MKWSDDVREDNIQPYLKAIRARCQSIVQVTQGEWKTGRMQSLNDMGELSRGIYAGGEKIAETTGDYCDEIADFIIRALPDLFALLDCADELIGKLDAGRDSPMSNPPLAGYVIKLENELIESRKELIRIYNQKGLAHLYKLKNLVGVENQDEIEKMDIEAVFDYVERIKAELAENRKFILESVMDGAKPFVGGKKQGEKQ